MESRTKAKVSDIEVKALCLESLKSECINVSELNDGYYNISYLVQLLDGRELVLKIAPPQEVDVLTYEKNIMTAEILFYKLVKERTNIIVPEIIFVDLACKNFHLPFYFMSKIEGVTLNKVDNISVAMRQSVTVQLAEILREIHKIKGKTFGYISMESQCLGKSYFESFMVSVQAIIDDGYRKDSGFPLNIEEVLSTFSKCEQAFNEVKIPCLVHYDLWDGNIFVEDQQDMKVKGIIDFERGFYGDPAADLCHVVGNTDLNEADYFWQVYNKDKDEPLLYDKSMKIRIYAYRLYLFLIMHVECFYRDIDGNFEPQKKWVSKEILNIHQQLNEAINI